MSQLHTKNNDTHSIKTLWNAAEIAEATGASIAGENADSWGAGGVVIDSRKLNAGDIFVALKGEHVDGHDYVVRAIEAGAAAALVSEDREEFEAIQDKLIRVADVAKALNDLATYRRAQYAGRVVGITGSVGKTGCKEMLRTALSAEGSVHATAGNYNNLLGLPLTIANLPKEADFAVLEMGMNHAGELTQLSDLAKPHVSVITTIEKAHVEFFDSTDEIADAKAEIFNGMGGEGVAILNADNLYYDRLKRKAEKVGLDRILAFGTHDDALCRMIDYNFDLNGSEVHAVIANTRMTYSMEAIGKHWGLMSVAVLAAADAVGADLPTCAAALSQFKEPKGRGSIAKLPVKGGYLRLIDDSYNASPASMEAAFEKLYALKTKARGCRTIAVMGDMLELGDEATGLHLGLVPSLVNNQVDLVFAAGQLMHHMYGALPDTMKGAYDATASGLAPKVANQLQPADIVLVKGSNGSQISKVVTAIERACEE